MQTFDVDGLVFSFKDEWKVGLYDKWQFYRNQFAKAREGSKAMDLVAISPDSTTWLIEVKDYRVHPRVKSVALGAEVAQKVYDTLAALLPASVCASEIQEREVARACLRARKLRVVLHLEQPRRRSALRPAGAIDPANIKKDLKRLLKPVDAHPKIASMGNMGALDWNVQ